MKDRKKRVLFVGEASFLATGFSTYWNEVIKRIHATGRFEVAELGSYASVDDPRCKQVPWRFYPVIPSRDDQEAMRIYHSNQTNQFGEAVFADVCLDFKPDIVTTITDWWMQEHLFRSPLRKNYRILSMPTIDGEPQRDIWLDTYKQCDGVLTYSDYGMDLLKKTGRPGTKLLTVASPGADLDVFKPVPDKREHKKKLGIDPNTNIIGTVMRNQARKLYYDLIEAFSMWVHKAKTKGHLDLVKKTFLYLHTSYPDVGYDIGKAIRDCKVGNKVLMTYMCENCHVVYPSFFSEELAICKRCGKLAAHPPNANGGVSREVLAGIINTFDMYVQYSVCLGKDEEIQTRTGWKKISEIKVGEEVLTHKNRYRKVIQKFISQNEGNTKEISVHSDYEKLIITDNHPCYAINKNILKTDNANSVREILGNRIRNEWSIPSPDFIQVANLEIGDMLALSIDDTIEDIDKIDLANFIKKEDIISDNSIKTFHGDMYPRYIDVNEEFCEFLGLYVADGSSSKSGGSLQITYANHETYNQQLCNNIWERLSNKKCTVVSYSDRKAKDSRMYSRIYRDTFNQWCGRKENKCLPEWSLRLPNNKTKAILKGLFIGDGHKQTSRKCSTYCTISKTLADQIKHLLRRNRINFNVHIDYRDDDKDKKNRKPQYLFEVPGFICDDEFRSNTRSSTNSLYYNNYHLLKIMDIKDSKYSNEVHNMEVEEDNSYTSKITTLHNCEGYGMPLSEAIACGVPVAAVDYSAMQDHLKCPTSMPIRVDRFFWETVIQTEQKRALPDNRDLVNTIDKFFKQSEDTRIKNTLKTRQYAEELCPVYNTELLLPRLGWERTAAIWSQAISETPILDSDTTWNNPELQLIKPNFTPPKNDMSNVEFIRWLIGDIWGRPELMNTHIAYEWIKSLNSGFRTMGDKRVPFTRRDAANHFMEIIKYANQVEEKRFGLLNQASRSDDLQIFLM